MLNIGLTNKKKDEEIQHYIEENFMFVTFYYNFRLFNIVYTNSM